MNSKRAYHRKHRRLSQLANRLHAQAHNSKVNFGKKLRELMKQRVQLT